MAKELEFHYDAGHGWLRVDMASLSAAGLRIGDFSKFSYRKGDFIYLEEDCDAGKFDACARARGFAFTVREVSDGNSSPIRNYARIIPGLAA